MYSKQYIAYAIIKIQKQNNFKKISKYQGCQDEKN